jgi:hypothetical protein
MRPATTPTPAVLEPVDWRFRGGIETSRPARDRGKFPAENNALRHGTPAAPGRGSLETRSPSMLNPIATKLLSALACAGVLTVATEASASWQHCGPQNYRNVTDCGAAPCTIEINQPGCWTIPSTLVNKNIKITVDSVNLDCAGNEVMSGPGQNPVPAVGDLRNGIWINNPAMRLQFISINHCSVEGWENGIYATNVRFLNISDSGAFFCNDGFDINESSGVTISRSDLICNGYNDTCTAVNQLGADGLDLDSDTYLTTDTVTTYLSSGDGISVNNKSGGVPGMRNNHLVFRNGKSMQNTYAGIQLRRSDITEVSGYNMFWNGADLAIIDSTQTNAFSNSCTSLPTNVCNVFTP